MERLALADSMLVSVRDEVPRARGFSLHLQRFTEGLITVGAEIDPNPFFEASRRKIHNFTHITGDTFPRFECWETNGTFRLDLNLRSAPPRRETIELVSKERENLPNRHIKGPNIETYTAWTRKKGSELLLTEHGYAVEGTTTTLVWWEQDTLMLLPGAGVVRVASVIEQLIVALAAEVHQPVAVAARTPQELVGFEVWAVNALHGIRRVTSIDGVASPFHNEARLLQWQDLLNATWEPVVPAQ